MKDAGMRKMKWEEELLSNPPVAYITNKQKLLTQCHTCRSKSSSSENTDYIDWIEFLASFRTRKHKTRQSDNK
ncbi:hypothetical protein VNO80_17665 [Phaseolus coccineus]|uniref:Uncharacterized protein n=1 Tax=Phaseolus coccineus TaxID=3886 RepID=A0AAN9MCV3_PHACN